MSTQDSVIDDLIIEPKFKPSTSLIKKHKQPKQEIKDMDKEKFHKAKADHKAQIERIKIARKQAAQDIKRHKLLIKQAKIMYKLTKMKEA